MRGYVLLVALSLAGAAGAAAGINRHTIEFQGKGYLGVVDGMVCVVSSRPKGTYYDWEVIPDGKLPLRVLAPQRWRGWYLAYDPEGKDKTVSLVRKPGSGTEWEVARVKGPTAGLYDYSIRAAEGKLKGWYLDIEPRGEQLKDAKGKRFTAYRVLLTQTPKHLPKGAEIIEIAP